MVIQTPKKESALRFLVSLAVVFTLSIASAKGQGEDETQEEPEAPDFLSTLEWTNGPAEVPIELIATLKLREGLRSIASRDTQKLQAALDNNTSEHELLTVMPMDDADWFLLFSWSDDGYVKDDDHDELDADAILEAMRKGQEADNARRKSSGRETLTIEGWAIKPRYNTSTNQLEWATNLKSGDGSNNVNYQTRILGRKGVMSAILVCSPERMSALIDDTQDILKGYAFASGEKYSEYKKGDKVAQYTLAGLVAGGAIAALAKLGFLQKFWKFLIIPFVAAGAWLKKLFGGKSAK
jgi:uncharacterized membrane-anchored protein